MKVKPNSNRKIEVMSDPVTGEAFKKPTAVPIVVRDPASGQFLPPAGKEVSENDTYWNRRLRAGDVVRCDARARKES